MGGAGARVLVAVGDERRRQALCLCLRESGLQVLEASNGVDALTLLRRVGADLMVLSVALPEIDGLELLRRVRQESRIPVILAVTRGEEAAGIAALEAGADDYVMLPAPVSEIGARANAVMRRARPAWAEGPVLRSGSLELDLATRRCMRDGQDLVLTRHEFDLLGALLRYEGRIHSREQLLELVWGDRSLRPKTVDVHVNSLRRKLGPEPRIVTLRGVGYRLDPE